MVVKRDFDKILVSLLRKYPYFVNIALIDAEGMPISFAVKKREFQIKPATLGSKTKVLLYLAKNFAKDVNITDPIIQVIFFEKIALMVVNLKVVNFFIIMDLKGWPPDGKLLYENFIEVKNLLSEVEKGKDDALKALFEDKSKEYKISDVSDTHLKVIAKNVNSLNQIQIEPMVVKKDPSLNPNDFNTYINYLSGKLKGKKILEGMCINETGITLFKQENTSDKFIQFQELIKTSFKELESFNLGKALWIVNIFEKSELLILTRLGQVLKADIYSGLLMENRLGNIKEITNLLYEIASQLNMVQPDENLPFFIKNLEFLGFSVDNLKIRIEKMLITGDIEGSELLMERTANLLEIQNRYSDAADYYYKLGESHIKKEDIEEAEQLFQLASNMHLKENNFDKAGDDYIRLGQIADANGDLLKAFESFDIALKYYKKGGNKESIKKATQEINKLKKDIKSELKSYISSATGESLPFSLFEKKFNISEDILVSIFKDLFDGNEISGQINLIKKRYTKKRYGTNEAIVGEVGVVGKDYELPKIDLGALSKRERILEAELAKLESTFERINFPFDKYIDYQNKLMELNFYEQKNKLYSNKVSSSTCIICFKNFNAKDRLCDCGNGHYSHFNCMKLWLENQTKCPVCEVNILDNLKVYFMDTLEAKDDLVSLQDIVKTLKTKIDNLEKQVQNREEQIYLMKDYSAKDKSVFEKLMVERDSKHLLEKELKKSNRLIEELRSLLEIIKK